MASAYYIIYFVALILISTVNYRIAKRDVMYPGFIYSFVWILVFGSYIFSPIEINSIGTTTCLLLVFGTVAFSLGCYVGKLCPMTWQTIKVDLPTQIKTNYLFFFYCLAVLPFFYKEVISFSADGFTSLKDNRSLIVESAESGKRIYASIITGSIIAIAIESTFVIFIEHAKGRKLIYFSVLLSITYCILNTGRTSLMTLILGLLAIYILKKRRPLRFGKAILIFSVPTILIIVFIVGYMFITHDDVGEDASMRVAIDYFFIYILGGIASLDFIIKSGNYIAPHHTFQIITQFINNLFGTSFEIPPVIDTFVYIPFPSNVYTVYKFFLLDFGFAGTFVAMGIIGTFHGIIYKAAIQGKKIGIYFYAITMYPMVMSFFDDTYYNFRGHIRDSLFVIFSYFVVPKLIRSLSRISLKIKW